MTNFNNKKFRDKNPDNKLELANKIANQSKKFVSTYAHVEETLLKFVRHLSSWLDKVLFNPKYAKVVSLLLAIALYMTVNANTKESIFGSPLQNSQDVNNVAVVAKYNSDTFELSALPTYANITITGEGSSVNTAANQKGVVVANLEGLTEGVHNIKLSTEGFNDNVKIKIEPSNVVLTLKKKTTGQFDLSYDYINLDKMNSIFSLSQPEFEFSKVNVRASKDTLDSIAFVKALINVKDVETDFSQEAMLVAYDKKGLPVNADIVPNTIKVNVKVTSPNKIVPVEVETTGDVPGGLAIEQIKLDHEVVTIYATESVLSKIDRVIVSLDASTLNKDSSILRPITLPTGVKSASINQINMDVTLSPGVTKRVDNVPIMYKNNMNKYKFTTLNNQSTASVELFGTQKNVDEIKADKIVVYFDMANAVPGNQDFKLFVEQGVGSLVKYSLAQTNIQVTVSGETTGDERQVIGRE